MQTVLLRTNFKHNNRDSEGDEIVIRLSKSDPDRKSQGGLPQ